MWCNENRKSPTQSNKIHLKYALARGCFLSWAPFSPQSVTVNILALGEILDFLFQVSRWPLHLTQRWSVTASLKAPISLAIALIKTYLSRSAAQSSFNLVTLTVLLNSGIHYPNPLLLLLLSISLNLTYSNAILLLFVQTMTSLTITSGSAAP